MNNNFNQQYYSQTPNSFDTQFPPYNSNNANNNVYYGEALVPSSQAPQQLPPLQYSQENGPIASRFSPENGPIASRFPQQNGATSGFPQQNPPASGFSQQNATNSFPQQNPPTSAFPQQNPPTSTFPPMEFGYNLYSQPYGKPQPPQYYPELSFSNQDWNNTYVQKVRHSDGQLYTFPQPNVDTFPTVSTLTVLANSFTSPAAGFANGNSTFSGAKHKPKLIRTATLAKDATENFSGQTASNSSSSVSPTDPVRSNGYTNILVTITRPLITALQDWTPEEIRSKRRLLLFDWNLNGTVLQVSFRPISQLEYVPNSPVISCIYWDYKNDYYVTSVDVIFLLEQLSGNQSFDIKEKNRIRRNLQTVESLTIGKTNSSGENLKIQSHSGRNFVKHTINPIEVNKIFDLIMKYDAPRPRRIEKDIKIYKWSLLEDALLRVLTKYCYNQKSA